jgi:two-component system phosphate regulon sensor histidine kinase PhoR
MRDTDDPATRLSSLPFVLLGLSLAGSFLILIGLSVSPGTALAALWPVLVVGLGLPLLLRRRQKARPSLQPGRRGRLSVWPDQGLRTLTGALGAAALLTDGKGVVRYLNADAAALFPNLRPGEQLVIGLRQPSVLAALERVRETAEAERVGWTVRVPAEQWFEARLAPITYPPRPEGNTTREPPDFILITIDDLTERYRLDRMRSDFVANASHELRTPLAAVSGFIETLQGPAREDPVARDRFLAIMSEQARRMRRLIDDLLSLSRIEMKAHMRPTELVDVGEILRRVGAALAPLMADAHVVLDLDIAEGPLSVRGEGDELAQVLSNLIENAVKYGGDDKTVTARVMRIEDGDGCGLIEVSVSDQGPGIAPEHVPRLTERFYRVDVASSRAKQGTGLGLAIVKHIVTRHRGRLAISSRPGEGATFSVTLPESTKTH